MSEVVLLVDAHDDSVFGSKAVGLGQAARAGLPLPPGVALAGPIVEAVASGVEAAIAQVDELVRPLGRTRWPCDRPRWTRTARRRASPDST